MATYRYWQHFLALESDFVATTRYVELHPRNYSTYSVEYAKLLLAACSEVDVLCKVICERLDPSASMRNINDYRACIRSHTEIDTEEVLIRRYGIELHPWSAWAGSSNPPWWSGYNSVKHQRDVHFAEANLGNCLESLSALMILVLYSHTVEQSADDLTPSPILLGREKEPGSLLLEATYRVKPLKAASGFNSHVPSGP